MWLAIENRGIPPQSRSATSALPKLRRAQATKGLGFMVPPVKLLPPGRLLNGILPGSPIPFRNRVIPTRYQRRRSIPVKILHAGK